MLDDALKSILDEPGSIVGASAGFCGLSSCAWAVKQEFEQLVEAIGVVLAT